MTTPVLIGEAMGQLVAYFEILLAILTIREIIRLFESPERRGEHRELETPRERLQEDQTLKKEIEKIREMLKLQKEEEGTEEEKHRLIKDIEKLVVEGVIETKELIMILTGLVKLNENIIAAIDNKNFIDEEKNKVQLLKVLYENFEPLQKRISNINQAISNLSKGLIERINQHLKGLMNEEIKSKESILYEKTTNKHRQGSTFKNHLEEYLTNKYCNQVKEQYKLNLEELVETRQTLSLAQQVININKNIQIHLYNGIKNIEGKKPKEAKKEFEECCKLLKVVMDICRKILKIDSNMEKIEKEIKKLELSEDEELDVIKKYEKIYS